MTKEEIEKLIEEHDKFAITQHILQNQSVSGLHHDTCIALRHLLSVNERLREALKPFAAIKPSSIFASDGSEAEKYQAVLRVDTTDFTGADLARARAALEAA